MHVHIVLMVFQSLTVTTEKDLIQQNGLTIFPPIYEGTCINLFQKDLKLIMFASLSFSLALTCLLYIILP